MYKAFAAHFLLIAFIVYIFASIIRGILTGIFGVSGNAAAAVIDLFAMFLLQAALVKAVQDVRDGRVDLDVRGTLSAAVPYLLPVTGASILAVIGIAVGFVFIIVPGLVLLTFWSLIVPSIVIGESPAMASFGRSWRTVRGHAWNVFGTIVLVWLILVVVEVALALIFAVLPQWLRSSLADILAGTVITPFIAIVVSLVYYRLTAAHEGQAAPPGYPPPGYDYPPAGPPPTA